MFPFCALGEVKGINSWNCFNPKLPVNLLTSPPGGRTGFAGSSAGLRHDLALNRFIPVK